MVTFFDRDRFAFATLDGEKNFVFHGNGRVGFIG